MRVACGAAFLTRGFIAWAIPAVVSPRRTSLAPQLAQLLISPWLPFGVAILVSLLWGVLVHLREPDFWRYFVIVEHLQRFAGTTRSTRSRPGSSVAYLPAIGWPWIWLLPAAVIGIRGDGRSKDFLFYTALWAVMPLLFFSASKGKLLTYVLPCFAPLRYCSRRGSSVTSRRSHARVPHRSGPGGRAARAAARPARRVAGGQTRRARIWARRAWEVGYDGALLAAALVCADRGPEHGHAHGTGRVHVRRRRVLPAARRRAPQRAIDGFAPSTAIAHHVATPADTVLVSDASLAGAVAWELNRQDVYVVNPGEMNYGLSYPEARQRKLTASMLGDLIASNRGVHDVLVCASPTPRKRSIRSCHRARSARRTVAFASADSPLRIVARRLPAADTV